MNTKEQILLLEAKIEQGIALFDTLHTLLEAGKKEADKPDFEKFLNSMQDSYNASIKLLNE